jgi:hypothetical protein
LSNHHFDDAGKHQNNKPKDNNDKGANNNNKEETPEMSFAILERKCYCCGKAVHKSPLCHLKDKTPKEEWAINKARITEQSHVNSDYNTNGGNPISLVNHSVKSVKENKLLYTDRQIQRAKLARSIYHAIRMPSLKDFKMIITSNTIKNVPITINDINISEKVFGPDIGALKGKTTRQKPAPVVSYYVEIPKELVYNHQSVVLCMDGMKINGVPFLTTISRSIMYQTAEWIPHQTPEAYRSVLEQEE